MEADFQEIIDKQSDAWGIKVTNIEIKHVDLNENMIRVITKQAEAERERRAKIIHAEGELQASEKNAGCGQCYFRKSAGYAVEISTDVKRYVPGRTIWEKSMP